MVSRDFHLFYIADQAGQESIVLLTAGIHEDEYEGLAALNHLTRTLDASSMAGQIIVLSVANPPAV